MMAKGAVWLLQQLHESFGTTVVVPEKKRSPKPRTNGLTMIIDKGLSPMETAAMLDLAADYIDYWKLGFGTALLYTPKVLAEKIRLARQHDVAIYTGGTLLELAVAQGTPERFIDRAAALGFTALEVSEGTIDLSRQRRGILIKRGLAAGLQVISEVGKKDPRHKFDPAEAAAAIADDLEAGARFVIVEGRDSGAGVGMYTPDGTVKDELSTALVDRVPSIDVIMWEAPRTSQQTVWLQQFGCNVNLGNVQPHDIISLEALRRSLRGDTLARYVGKGPMR